MLPASPDTLKSAGTDNAGCREADLADDQSSKASAIGGADREAVARLVSTRISGRVVVERSDIAIHNGRGLTRGNSAKHEDRYSQDDLPGLWISSAMAIGTPRVLTV